MVSLKYSTPEGIGIIHGSYELKCPLLAKEIMLTSVILGVGWRNIPIRHGYLKILAPTLYVTMEESPIKGTLVFLSYRISSVQ